MRKIVELWYESETYRDLRDRAWSNYIHWADNQLILAGKV